MAKAKEQGQENAAKRGFIISYNSENGYGFVRGEDVQDFYFKIAAFKENTLPQVGQRVIFELSNRPAKEGKNPPISWLKYDESGTNEVGQGSGAATKAQSNDSRIVCPHCNAKIMPRMAFQQGRPVASYCPLCGGKVKFRKSIDFCCNCWHYSRGFVFLLATTCQAPCFKAFWMINLRRFQTAF